MNKNRLFCVLLLMWVGLPVSAFAQQNTLDSTFLDFWVGNWAASWEGGKGTNRIEKILDDKVISENFEITEGENAGFKGKSYSVQDQTGAWKQTWVDNAGGYLDFEGKTEGEKRIFWREVETQEGKPLQQRMVFYNISREKFDWDWERSTDRGKTWQLQWRIGYTRIE